MESLPYSFQQKQPTRYTFTSKGRNGAILKSVQFTPTAIPNIFNLSLGDIKNENSIDDSAASNNHDIIKIMRTIIEIIDDFTSANPNSKIFFTGNSSIKTSLYRRILKMYFHHFSKTYFITALVKNNHSLKEVIFSATGEEKYLAFIVKRKL